jgi:hypothetical protein
MTKLQEVKVADAAKTALTAIDTSTQQPGVDAQSRAREAAAERMTAMYSRSN